MIFASVFIALSLVPVHAQPHCHNYLVLVLALVTLLHAVHGEHYVKTVELHMETVIVAKIAMSLVTAVQMLSALEVGISYHS